MPKTHLWKNFALMIIIIMVCARSSEAASFDCAKAQTQLEKTICDDSQLNDADAKLGKVYFELMDLLSGKEADELKQEQRTWLKERMKICSADNAICLLGVYEKRVTVLQSKLSAKTEQSSAGNLRIETVTHTINESFPPMNFKIYWKDGGNWFDEIVTIEIYNSQNSKLLQRLTNLEESYCWAISFEDYNFDGFLDFRLENTGAVLGNVLGDIYLFEPKSQKYTFHQGFSDLTSIRVDPATKILYSNSRSRAGIMVTYQRLKFTDGRLIVIYERTTELKEENGVSYTYVSDRIFDENGQLKMVGNKKVKEDDLWEDDNFSMETVPLGELP